LTVPRPPGRVTHQRVLSSRTPLPPSTLNESTYRQYLASYSGWTFIARRSVLGALSIRTATRTASRCLGSIPSVYSIDGQGGAGLAPPTVALTMGVASTEHNTIARTLALLAAPKLGDCPPLMPDRRGGFIRHFPARSCVLVEHLP